MLELMLIDFNSNNPVITDFNQLNLVEKLLFKQKRNFTRLNSFRMTKVTKEEI
jgi:hypothetical protein